MIERYKDEILQSFLENFSRIYLIDLEKDTIVKVHESAPLRFLPVHPVFHKNRYDSPAKR